MDQIPEGVNPDDLVQCRYRSFETGLGRINEVQTLFRGVQLSLRWNDVPDDEGRRKQRRDIALLLDNMEDPIARAMEEANIQEATKSLEFELNELLRKGE